MFGFSIFFKRGVSIGFSLFRLPLHLLSDFQRHQECLRWISLEILQIFIYKFWSKSFVVPSRFRVLRIIVIIFIKPGFFKLVHNEVILLDADPRVVYILCNVRNSILFLLELVKLNILLRLWPHMMMRFWRRFNHHRVLDLKVFFWLSSLALVKRKSGRVLTFKFHTSEFALVQHKLLEQLLLVLSCLSWVEINLRVGVRLRAFIILLLRILMSWVNRWLRNIFKASRWI